MVKGWVWTVTIVGRACTTNNSTFERWHLPGGCIQVEDEENPDDPFTVRRILKWRDGKLPPSMVPPTPPDLDPQGFPTLLGKHEALPQPPSGSEDEGGGGSGSSSSSSDNDGEDDGELAVRARRRRNSRVQSSSSSSEDEDEDGRKKARGGKGRGGAAAGARGLKRSSSGLTSTGVAGAASPPAKRGPGRPRKHPRPDGEEPPAKRPRGRPRKDAGASAGSGEGTAPKRKPGRPPKNAAAATVAGGSPPTETGDGGDGGGSRGPSAEPAAGREGSPKVERGAAAEEGTGNGPAVSSEPPAGSGAGKAAGRASRDPRLAKEPNAEEDGGADAKQLGPGASRPPPLLTAEQLAKRKMFNPGPPPRTGGLGAVPTAKSQREAGYSGTVKLDPGKPGGASGPGLGAGSAKPARPVAGMPVPAKLATAAGVSGAVRGSGSGATAVAAAAATVKSESGAAGTGQEPAGDVQAKPSTKVSDEALAQIPQPPQLPQPIAVSLPQPARPLPSLPASLAAGPAVAVKASLPSRVTSVVSLAAAVGTAAEQGQGAAGGGGGGGGGMTGSTARLLPAVPALAAIMPAAASAGAGAAPGAGAAGTAAAAAASAVVAAEALSAAAEAALRNGSTPEAAPADVQQLLGQQLGRALDALTNSQNAIKATANAAAAMVRAVGANRVARGFFDKLKELGEEAAVLAPEGCGGDATGDERVAGVLSRRLHVLYVMDSLLYR